MSESHHQELERVAAYLHVKQEAILDEWKSRIQESEKTSSKMIVLSREKFYDHIPVFLDQLIENLRNRTASEESPAREHGAERWEYGLDLRQVTKEWSILHEVLVEKLSLCLSSLSLTAEVLQEVQKIVTKNIHRGIMNSVDTFYQLENRKAEAKMQDLKDVVQKQEEEKKGHSHNLQQTSHDLKGNLHAIRTGLLLLRDRSYEDPKIPEIVDEMSLAADSLKQLLNDLLDLFRLEAGHAEMHAVSFDAAEVLKALCQSMKPMAEAEGLELRCDGADTLPVYGDRQKVRRVAQNLLLNALKYTESGRVEVNWKSEGEEQWLLRISDTGPGLSATHAASLSMKADAEEPAGRLNSDASSPRQNDSRAQSHGEGIGLLIVRHLCKLMNAAVEIDTSPGEGTTFSIYFRSKMQE